MIHYFRNKTKIKTKYYDKGFDTAKKIITKRWTKKHIKLKNDFDNIIAEKDNKIESLTEYVSEIENTMDKFTHFSSMAKYVSIKMEEENEVKFKQETNEYKTRQHLVGEIEQMHRFFERKYPEMEKKLNKFKRESLQ